jgi:hypothetical protein
MMPRIQTRRLAVLGGLLILNTASPSHGLFEEEESFGPQDAFEGPSYTNGYGNTSNQTNTTTTTTVTTTTELPAIPHIHIAYFLAKVNRTNPNTGAHNEPPENIDCSLTSIGQGAYFINLPVTETCEEMPDIEVHMPKMYYKLTIDMSNGNERNITHLTAFCTESEAGLCSNCKVDRVPDTVIHPDYPHGLMGNSVLRYDLCEPTEGKEDFSYFVRQGKGSDNLKKDICLLKNQVCV